jgi:phage major head subunit gpT-like protein
MDKDTDPEVFNRKKVLYGVDTRFNFAYGDWRQAYRAAGA